jgi:hypothetical protein
VRRSMLIGVLVFGGCQAVERAAISPLPEDIGPMPFADLLSRARLQAMAANEAFYVDNWLVLDESARGIEQTARFLKKAKDVPAARMPDLESRCDLLAREAAQLRNAAQKHDVDQSNAILQRIHFQVRELRS